MATKSPPLVSTDVFVEGSDDDKSAKAGGGIICGGASAKFTFNFWPGLLESLGAETDWCSSVEPVEMTI